MKYALILWMAQAAIAAAVLPPPKFERHSAGFVNLGAVRVERRGASPKSALAREWLERELRSRGARIDSEAARIELSEGSLEPGEPDDRRVLRDFPEQAYILHVDAARQRISIQAADGQGLLYGVATLLQLVDNELRAGSVHIRDYPDFRYRASADWLLQGEINRWGYDWGDGRAAFMARVRRKLDFCLRYKINVVFFDGFGWGTQRTTGYSGMMREINHYARDRGIKLIFGGYGYFYTPQNLRADRGIGAGLLNRQWYPDGPVYFCMPGDPLPRRGEETALRTHGTCRSNDELLRLRTRELEEFVRSVEPGALYIHHEDHGDFDPTQQGWLFRCEACRHRWPNDKLVAKDGGAGAIAHGYNSLLAAVRGVKNPSTGYDASRDCTVTLISPVYRLNEKSTDDWNNVLDFWQLTASMLPRDPNLQIGFREIFPSPAGQRWMDAFTSRMKSAGLDARTFVFLLGGSQGYENRYPLTATATLNRQYLGAETIYNFSGGVHQEPLQLLNAVYSWNSRAPGSVEAVASPDVKRIWTELVAGRQIPREIAQAGGLLDEILRELYGPQAAPFVRECLLLSEPRPVDPASRPNRIERITPLPVLFDVLERDQTTWSDRSALLHRRLAESWTMQERINELAEASIGKALAAGTKDGSREDLRYLSRCLNVGRRFSALLAVWHRVLAGESGETKLPAQVEELDRYLQSTFAFDMVCP